MSKDHYLDIFRDHLMGVQEDNIINDNEKTYDQAYTVIGLLIDKQIVCTWSDMEKLLIGLDISIVNRFKEKFKKKAPSQGLYKMPFFKQPAK